MQRKECLKSDTWGHTGKECSAELSESRDLEKTGARIELMFSANRRSDLVQYHVSGEIAVGGNVRVWRAVSRVIIDSTKQPIDCNTYRHQPNFRQCWSGEEDAIPSTGETA